MNYYVLAGFVDTKYASEKMDSLKTAALSMFFYFHKKQTKSCKDGMADWRENRKKGLENMCDMKKKLEVNFFDFAAERVCFIGENITEENDKELDQIAQQIREVLDPHLWHQYELRASLYYDQTMYYAYKQGFIDALRLFEEPRTTSYGTSLNG